MLRQVVGQGGGQQHAGAGRYAVAGKVKGVGDGAESEAGYGIEAHGFHNCPVGNIHISQGGGIGGAAAPGGIDLGIGKQGIGFGAHLFLQFGGFEDAVEDECQGVGDGVNTDDEGRH